MRTCVRPLADGLDDWITLLVRLSVSVTLRMHVVATVSLLLVPMTPIVTTGFPATPCSTLVARPLTMAAACSAPAHGPPNDHVYCT